MTSQINPADINGEYPVAGVSNNTQGMRDNFTNIKTNFQYAEDEINDLQSKGVFKAALTGTTLDNNMANNVIYNAQVRGMSGTVVTIAATSGTVNIDCNAGPYQTIAIAGNITLAFDNATWPPSGSFGMIRLRVTVDAAGRTMTLPASVSQGTNTIQGLLSGVLTFATAGTFEFGFSTINAGTTIVMYDFTRPLDYYTDTVTIANTAVSTNAGTGALIVAGGVGVSGNLYVTGDIVGNIVVTGSTFVGNVTAGNLLTGGLVSAAGNVTGGNLLTGGLVSAAGNVTGGNLLSTTLSLSGNVLSAINTTANITTTANISVGNALINGVTATTGNVTGGNLRTTGQMSASGNVTGGNISTGGLITVIGNVTGGNLNTGAQVVATGNITGGNILTVGLVQGSITSSTGNVIGGNVTTGGQVSATGNITSAANIAGGNVLTGGIVSATGNITGGNVLGGANVNAALFTGTTISVAANISGGNILSGAVVSAVGAATILSGTAIPAGGTTGAGYKMSSTANLGIFFGSGAPTLTAAQGSLYLRTDGSATSDRMYINTDGTTTWTPVITAS
jgi:hypothetical protein